MTPGAIDPQIAPQEGARTDLAQARHFIELLTGSADTQCTWQTFDDSRAKRRHLAQVIHGPLSLVHGELERLSKQGAGVFVTVNETDLVGRQSQNIVALRALFVDSDTGPIDRASLPCDPSFIVNSSRGQHAYWLLVPGQSLDAFGDAQSHLAEALGTDPKIHDLPRVMRVPGFLHRKGEPFLVTVSHASPSLYFSISDIINRLPPRKAKPAPQWQPSAPVGPVNSNNKLEKCRRYFQAIPGAVEGSGGDQHTYRAACIAVRDFDLSDSEALDVLSDWNRTCSPPWEIRDLEDKIRHARKHGKGSYGSKLIDLRPRLAAVSSLPSSGNEGASVDTANEKPRALTMAQLMDAWREASKHERFLPTGLSVIDGPLGGGLPLGVISTLMGGTGVGKSEIVRQLARSIAGLGAKVLHIDTELNEVLIGDRWLAQQSGIAAVTLSTPSKWSDGQHEAIDTATKELEALPISTLFTAPLPLMDLWLVVVGELEKMGPGPKLIILDSIQQLSSAADGKERRHQVENFMRWAIALGKETGAAVLATCERKRTMRDQSADVGDAAESRAIEYQSHVLMVVEKTQDPNDDIADDADSTWDKRLKLSILKNRCGRPGKVKHDIILHGPCWGMRLEDREDPRADAILELMQDEVVRSIGDIERALNKQNGSLSPLIKSMARAGKLKKLDITGHSNRVKYQIVLSPNTPSFSTLPGRVDDWGE